MDCPECGYELAVKEIKKNAAGVEVLILTCRNKQCRMHGNEWWGRQGAEEAQK